MDVVGKIRDNINNDNLSTSRKITDSIIDYQMTVYSIGVPMAISILVTSAAGHGVGAAAGVGVGLIFNIVLEHTSIVYDYKEAAGLVTDQAISLFDRLFN